MLSWARLPLQLHIASSNQTTLTRNGQPESEDWCVTKTCLPIEMRTSSTHLLCCKHFMYSPSRLTSYTSKICIRQGITLTGLGLQEFDSQVQAVSDIYSEFCTRIPMPCKPFMEGLFEEFPAINTATRVFTSRNMAGGQQDIQFSDLEDPDGTLQRAKGDEFIHGEENYVEYRKVLITNEGITRSVASATDRNTIY